MGKLFNLAKAVIDGKPEMIKKAATDLEVGGTLTPRNAVNLFNSVTKNADVFNRIRLVEMYENTGKLSDVITKAVLTDRAGAATAKTALNAGNDIAGITKDNIGNSVTLKELYFLFNLKFEEITNMARTQLAGAGNFESLVGTQFATSTEDILEEMMWSGDNTDDEPYGFEVNAKANLADPGFSLTAPIKKVRYVDTGAMATQLEKLRAIRNITKVAVRKKGVWFMNIADADKYVDEVKDSSSESGNGWITRDGKTLLAFDGTEIIATPYISEGTIMFSPLDNMCKCINVKNAMAIAEEIKIPYSLVYCMLNFWNLQFITYDQVSIGYDIA